MESLLKLGIFKRILDDKILFSNKKLMGTYPLEITLPNFQAFLFIFPKINNAVLWLAVKGHKLTVFWIRLNFGDGIDQWYADELSILFLFDGVDLA